MNNSINTFKKSRKISRGLQHEIKRCKQVEAALHESETAFRNLFEYSKDPVLLLKNGRFIDCNKATLTELGYGSKAEFIDCHPCDISPKLQSNGRRSEEQADEMLHTAEQTGYHRFEWLYLRADGSVFPVEVSLTAISIKGDAIIHVCWRNISERKTEIENQLRWKFAIEGAGDGVWDWDIQTDEVQYTKIWKSMLGYSEDDILPANDEWKFRIHPDDRAYVANTMQAYLEDKTDIYLVEYRLKCKNDSYKWILGRGMIVSRDLNGNPLRMIGTHTDITRMREAELKANLANQAKSTFIANMSHELRSPLNAIIGFSQIMLRSKNLPKEQYENAGIIQRSGDYLLTLINNVLDFSKIEVGKTTLNLESIDFYQLLNDLEDMLHLRAANKDLELIFVRGDNLPRYIHADGVKLRQVLLNLLGNAIKFTKQGEVVLTINSEIIDSEKYTLNFSICDTGVGIAANELNKLFEAFSQTSSGRESQEGSGLGLVISQQFVRLMGGDITVTSELGKGTCFNFDIQVRLGKEISDNSPLNERRVIGLAQNQAIYKLLIVDDKAINRQLVVKLLAPLGFELKEASNGQEAINIWEDWQPHLIWMDMRMPVMDGYEATKTIKSQVKGSATAVIALTASVLEEEKAIVMSAGCDDFVRKPFRENTLFEILTKHLGVQFIYEDTNSDTLNQAEPTLTAQHFQVMPRKWLLKLSKAALEADSGQVQALIQEIPESEAFLAQSLTKKVRQFQFEQILDFIEPHLS